MIGPLDDRRATRPPARARWMIDSSGESAMPMPGRRILTLRDVMILMLRDVMAHASPFLPPAIWSRQTGHQGSAEIVRLDDRRRATGALAGRNQEVAGRPAAAAIPPAIRSRRSEERRSGRRSRSTA
jgi:hypothetical protein